MKSKQIFLMYSVKDLDRIKIFFKFLTNNNIYKIWFAGDPFLKLKIIDNRLINSIEEVDTVLYFLSKSSTANSDSKFLNKERKKLFKLLEKGINIKIIIIRFDKEGICPNEISIYPEIDLSEEYNKDFSKSLKIESLVNLLNN